MKISQNGINFIKREEGEHLTSYVDSLGIPTIGVGHTGLVKGNPVKVGMTITEEQSSELLMGDLVWVEDALNNYVKSPLNQNQYDSLCSFVFNIGANAFESSTMVKLLNISDYHGVANEFLKWSRAGNDQNILLPRRQRERALFIL